MVACPEKWLDFCLYSGVQTGPKAGGCKADVQRTTGRIRI